MRYVVVQEPLISVQSQVHHGNSPKKSNSMGLNANGSNLNLKFSDLSDQDSTIDETKPLYIDEVSFQMISDWSRGFQLSDWSL